MITTAFINIWNKRVGAIAWDVDTELASFEFESSFLANEWDLSPLKMPIANAAKRVFSFPELKGTTTFKGLPGLLADVLPDKYGNSLINAWLSKNGRPSDSMNPVELLCFIGKRGMGALEFEPVVPKINNGATKIELDSLIHIAQEILSGRQDFNTNLSGEEAKALSDILKIGSSAGGARAKAVIAFNPDTKEIRSGQADAPKGFTHWLLKFDGVTDQQLGTSSGYGRVEMAYHLMAKEAEIEMTECRLLEENGRAHFMTRRFDREHGKGKLHIQSFCAIAHYDFNEVTSFSYEQLFETMRSMLLPYTDADQLYRRMVFDVMARNCDDHTKNFSFSMDKTGQWKLAPAFDVCHSYRPDSTWVSQHSLSINGKRKNITRDDLLEVAKNMNIKKADTIITQLNAIVSKWNDFAAQTNVKADLRDAVGKTLLLL
ncbi:MAG: type II toxin-antitoxin system HipA family toxin [Chitinophagaceae bacterium]|nr:type II toxin-antitoxin system HipA family toxin [Chitinophagaceae bacterium]MDP1812528.1 type II toxin-antitoxin system HipA family toxin [Sediminibacterium sp.]MDP3128285.1 type II toxin-antitoxin system HipA family toxin [Sediminibacterium sp.]